jgi:hypothetical protein
MKKSLMYLMTAVMIAVFSFGVSSCSKDDDVSKSNLIGTWYNIEEGCIYVFSESICTEYFLHSNGYNYYLSKDSITFGYSVNGDILTSQIGQSVKFLISDNKLYLPTINDEPSIYTKFDGTPEQLVDYLNNLAD